jgi:hypothetical protein
MITIRLCTFIFSMPILHVFMLEQYILYGIDFHQEPIVMFVYM